MSFLTINKHEVTIAHNECKISVEYLTNFDRTVLGAGRVTELNKPKRVWALKTPPMTYAEANLLGVLVNGQGLCWDFENDFYAVNKGIGPTSYTGASSASNAKYGARSLYLSGSTVNWIVYLGASFLKDWSIYFWRFDSGSSHKHHVISYNYAAAQTTQYYDGSVYTGHTWSSYMYYMSSGSLRLQGCDTDNNSVASYFDELIVLPCCATAEFVASLKAAGVAFQAPPYMDITGDMVDDETVKVYGRDFSVTYLMGHKDGSWQNNLAVCNFSLVEV